MLKPQKKRLWIEKIEKPISKITNIENKKTKCPPLSSIAKPHLAAKLY